MNKGIMLLADGFELCEALITIDLLRRANIDIETVSMMKELEVLSQSNVLIKADKMVKEINCDDYNFMILPGGGAIFKNHLNNEITLNIIKDFNDKQKLVCAICAAPMVLAKLGLLHNKNFVCFPGCKEGLDGKYSKSKKVVKEGNIITSKAMGTTFEFAYEIIKTLLDEKVAKEVLKKVYYE